MTTSSPRITLVHAVTVAIPPVVDAFASLWPEARIQHLLDDALSPDRESDGALTATMRKRIVSLAEYALLGGAHGILYTCSAFGPAIDRAKQVMPIPILKPNEAMFADALSRGARIGMLATFAPSVASMEQEFYAMAADIGTTATLRTVCLPDAMQALRAGNGDEHDRLLAKAATGMTDCDVVLLAHFSTSRAHAAVADVIAMPVLTSPRSAVTELRRQIGAKQV